jgi:uncharacterized damage-inducible protein DinB
MSLKSASQHILTQLAEVIGQLSDSDYARPLPVLSENSVGKHVRHTLEFYELLVDGAQNGYLNYDRRPRKLRLETDTEEALQRIAFIDQAIRRLDLNQPLILEADLSVTGTAVTSISSLLSRELLYNIEHAIHHMALIQIAVREAFPHVELPPHFGVAYSTVQYQSR